MPKNATVRVGNRSLAARNQLVTDHRNLVSAIAGDLAGMLPSHLDFEDVAQAGTFGLIKAAERFDNRKGIAFPAYARHRIRGAILDHLRTQDWASRQLRLRERQLAQAEEQLMAALKRPPSEEELAARLSVSLKHLRQTRQQSLFCPVQAGDSSSESRQAQSWPMELAGRMDDRPDIIAERRQTAEVLRGAMEELPKRSRSIITMYYHCALTMKQIGTEFGINESRVSQLHREAISQLAATLVARGMSAELLSVSA